MSKIGQPSWAFPVVILAVVAIMSVFFIFPRSVNEEEQVAEVVTEVDPEVQESHELMNELMQKMDELIVVTRDALEQREAEAEAEEIVAVATPEPEPEEVVVEVSDFVDCGNGQLIPRERDEGAKVAPCGGLFLHSKRKIRPGTYLMNNGIATVH